MKEICVECCLVELPVADESTDALSLVCSPLIVLDLLWNMDAPYKVTMALLVLTCLVVAVASAAAPAPSNYAWFCMGMFLFGGTYYGIIMIVRERLEFYVEMARDSNAKQSIKFLKTGCYIFFLIWVLYPIFWLLGKNGAQIMSDELDHVISAVMDVIAKSAYGFALLYFRLYFDKKLIQAGVDAEDFHQFSKVAISTMKHRPSDKYSYDWYDRSGRSSTNHHHDKHQDHDSCYNERLDDEDYDDLRRCAGSTDLKAFAPAIEFSPLQERIRISKQVLMTCPA